MPSFTDYYKPCEPGRGYLVNGQSYLPKYGDDTLQTMVTDEVFTNDDDVCDCDECRDKDVEIGDICENRDAWRAYAKDLITFMRSEGLTPPELPEELVEED